MCLYEHQSSYTPNMPLRGILYFADLYKKLLKNTDLSVRRLIRIPTPHYIVFYNGLEREDEEFIQHLSDAFEDDGEGCMELTVRVININLGHNKELLDKCSTLYGYAYFVSTVRKYLDTMDLTDAVGLAIEECLKADILTDFLLEHKAEVVAMSIYEYNEEYVMRIQYEDGMEEGYAKGYDSGVALGRQEGDARRLVQIIDSVLSNFENNLEQTCKMLNVTVEEYENAKSLLTDKE